MTHKNLYKNEVYLIVASLISIGVLSGYEYFDLALALLITVPAVHFLTKKVLNSSKVHLSNTDKCKYF